MTTTDRVRALVLPVLTERGLEIYDVEHAPPVLRVVVEATGGVDLDVLAEATRAVSRTLDAEDPIPGSYTLEVTSPGLERRLRTPQHFAGAVGEKVKVKVTPGVESDRRVDGVLAGADATGIEVRTGDDAAPRRLRYDEIARARTVFEWGPSDPPGRPSGSPASKASGSTSANAAGTSDEKRQGNR